jgi:hypothetical protein
MLMGIEALLFRSWLLVPTKEAAIMEKMFEERETSKD